MGATDAQLEGVALGNYDIFEPAWAAALRFADVLTPTPGTVPDDVYAAVAKHWAPAQLVEITSAICMFAFFNRFAHAFDIPVTR